MKSKKKKDKYFVFSVPATMVYEIQAETEAEAREILVEEGGLSIFGEQCDMTSEDYAQADLEQVYEM
jgi:hypothetical protein